jgi:hypothetical protein
MIDKLRLVVPPAALFVLALCMPGGAMLLMHEAAAPVPLPRPSMPPQEWTTDVPRGFSALGMHLQVLPLPGPNQKRSGECDPDQAQVEINGGCWVETKRPPPCPSMKLWEHSGKCWLPVAHAARLPTSGEPRNPSVAEPREYQ